MTDASGTGSDALDSVKDSAATATDAAKDTTAKAADVARQSTGKAADAVKDAAPAEKPPVPPRSMDEIEGDIAKARESLAGRLDDLQEYVSPKNVIARQVDKVKGVFVDEYGGIKPDKVAVAVGVVVAIVGISVLRRRRRRG